MVSLSDSRNKIAKLQAQRNFENQLKRQLYSAEEKEWQLAVEKHEKLTGYKGDNKEQLKRFQSRKIGNFTTEKRINEISDQATREIETAIEISKQPKMTKQELGRRVRKVLNNPAETERVMKNRKMKVHEYGKGQYKSSKANLIRFSSSEINTAYKKSDWLLVQQNPNIKGIEIYLSPQHKVYDICDELEGLYPKEFYYSGWHYGCMCGMRYVLDKEIKDVPKGFKNWIAENENRISEWKHTPDWVAENGKFVNPDISKLMYKAQQSSPEMEKMLSDVLKKYGGITTPLNYKSRDSIYRKVTTELDGNVWDVKDSVRATVILPIKKYEYLAKSLEKSGIFEGVKYQSPDKFSGYSGIITNFKTSNGITAEIQFNTDKMIYAKETPNVARKIIGVERWSEIQKETGLEGGLGHKYYEEMRILDKNKPKEKELWLKLNDKSINYYKSFR